MLRDELYNLTPRIPRLLGFSSWISKRFSNYFRFFKLIEFWQEHPSEFIFPEKGQAILKELGFKFEVKSTAPHAFELFFETRSKYKFQAENGEVYMEVGGFKFLLPFPHGIFELCEVFQDECYGLFDVEGKVVVDVGAFIGCSPIYFAGKGAEKIVAFEPNPDIAEVARKNVQLNKLGNRIQVRPEALAANPGVRPFLVNRFLPGSSALRNEVKGTMQLHVNTVSISSITHELGHVDLLKMDCEGAEYEILVAAYYDGAFTSIDQIAMEVHGSPEPIMSLLRQAGFEIAKNTRVGSAVELYPERFLLFAKKTMPELPAAEHKNLNPKRISPTC